MNEQLQRAPQRMNALQSVTVPETAIMPAAQNDGSIWDSVQAMAQAVRMAEYLAKANVIPQQYQKNPGDCLVAIDLGRRMNLSPVVVMQNSQIVYGNFSWKGAACKALVDNCGRFRNSRYEFCGKPGQMDWGCRLVAESTRTNQTVTGPWVTMQLAKDEGWLGKNGSKWKTMPELMMRYRAASFFAKTECPEVMMGFQTAEEIQDIAATKPTINQDTQSEAQGVDYGAGDFTDAALPAAPAEETPSISSQALTEAAAYAVAEIIREENREPGSTGEEQVKLDEL